MLAFRSSTRISNRIVLRRPISCTALYEKTRGRSHCFTEQFPWIVQRRIFSSSSSTALAKRTGFQRFQSRRWILIARSLRFVRIPFLVASVYGLGRQQGILECTRNPDLLQETILNTLLASMNVQPDQIEVVTQKDADAFSKSKHRRVAAIGHAIVTAAQVHVTDELRAAMEHVKLPSDCSQDDRLLAYRRDSQVQFWNDARLRLQGEYGDKQWQYLVMEADVANAFVTEVLPQRFFLTTGMLKVATTANELAVVLGHEGHVSDANLFETVLRTIEVLLLSIDPTAGAISLFVIGGLAAARRALSAGNSRINELQADELGLKLAAKACFDTRQGCEVIRKMHEHKVAAQPKADSQLQLLYDTHPPTLERYERMVEQSKVDNSTGQKQCATVASRLYNAMWSSNR